MIQEGINSFISFENGKVAIHKIGKIIPNFGRLYPADIEIWSASNNIKTAADS